MMDKKVSYFLFPSRLLNMLKEKWKGNYKQAKKRAIS